MKIEFQTMGILALMAYQAQGGIPDPQVLKVLKVLLVPEGMRVALALLVHQARRETWD